MLKPRSDRLVLGVIGVGDIATNVHLPVLSTMMDIKLGWLADINGRRATEIAKIFGIAATGDPKDVESLPAADIILLTVPYGNRETYYQYYAGTATSIYVEKPFALTVSEHVKRCSLFQEYQLCLGLQRRSSAMVDHVKHIIDEQYHGELIGIEFELGQPGITVGSRFHSDAKIAGGGMLFEVGIHGIDAAIFLSGAKGVAVHSASVVYDDGLDIHSDVTAQLSLPSGRCLPFRIKVSSLVETDNCMSLVFETARLQFSLFSDSPPKVYGKSKQKPVLITSFHPRTPSDTWGTFGAHWRAFISSVRDRKPNYTSAIASLLSTQLVEEIYRTKKDDTQC